MMSAAGFPLPKTTCVRPTARAHFWQSLIASWNVCKALCRSAMALPLVRARAAPLCKRHQGCLNRLLVGHPQPPDAASEKQSDPRKGVEDRFVIFIQWEVDDLRESWEINLYALVEMLDDLLQLLVPFHHLAKARQDDYIR